MGILTAALAGAACAADLDASSFYAVNSHGVFRDAWDHTAVFAAPLPPAAGAAATLGGFNVPSPGAWLRMEGAADRRSWHAVAGASLWSEGASSVVRTRRPGTGLAPPKAGEFPVWTELPQAWGTRGHASLLRIGRASSGAGGLATGWALEAAGASKAMYSRWATGPAPGRAGEAADESFARELRAVLGLDLPSRSGATLRFALAPGWRRLVRNVFRAETRDGLGGQVDGAGLGHARNTPSDPRVPAGRREGAELRFDVQAISGARTTELDLSVSSWRYGVRGSEVSGYWLYEAFRHGSYSRCPNLPWASSDYVPGVARETQVRAWTGRGTDSHVAISARRFLVPHDGLRVGAAIGVTHRRSSDDLSEAAAWSLTRDGRESGGFPVSVKTVESAEGSVRRIRDRSETSVLLPLAAEVRLSARLRGWVSVQVGRTWVRGRERHFVAGARPATLAVQDAEGPSTLSCERFAPLGDRGSRYLDSTETFRSVRAGGEWERPRLGTVGLGFGFAGGQTEAVVHVHHAF